MLANEPSSWSLTIALVRFRAVGVELRNQADTGVQLLCQQSLGSRQLKIAIRAAPLIMHGQNRLDIGMDIRTPDFR